MSWLAVDKDGTEKMFKRHPSRCKYNNDAWYDFFNTVVELRKGSIKKLIRKQLTWEDEPIELK